MNYVKLFYTCSLIYATVNFVLFLSQVSLFKRKKGQMLSYLQNTMKIGILLCLLDMGQLLYLFGMDSELVITYTFMWDLLAFIPGVLLFWICYLSISGRLRKQIFFIAGMSFCELLVITGLALFFPGLFLTYKDAILWFLPVIALIQLLLTSRAIRVTHKHPSFFALYFSPQSNVVDSYIQQSAVYFILKAAVLVTGVLLGGHWGRLIINVFWTFQALYVLTDWIQYHCLPHSLCEPEEFHQKCNSLEVPREEVKTTHPKGMLHDGLLQKTHQLLRDKKLYLNAELHLSDLLVHLNTNRTYLSSAINCNEHHNFYRLILCYRLHHFTQLIRNNPEMLLSTAAFESGFSSPKNLARVFRCEFKTTPSAYRELSHQEQDALLRLRKLDLDFTQSNPVDSVYLAEI